jgi:hypothetical protein
MTITTAIKIPHFAVVEPPQFVTISEIRNFIVEMSNEQLELWEMVNNNTFDKQNIFARTERLLKKVNDIDQKLDNILISPDRMLTTLSEEDWFMLNMNKLQTMKDFVDDNYEELSKYLEDKNSTIMEFVKRIVSPGNSTSYYMNELKNYVVAKDFLQPLHELLKVSLWSTIHIKINHCLVLKQPITGSMFCYEHHSSQQMLYNFLNDILLTNVKNFVLEQFAYTIMVFRDQGALLSLLSLLLLQQYDSVVLNCFLLILKEILRKKSKPHTRNLKIKSPK